VPEDVVNVGQITINGSVLLSAQQAELAAKQAALDKAKQLQTKQAAQQSAKTPPKPTPTKETENVIKKLTPIPDLEMATLNSKPSGNIMNSDPEAKAKKWDPEKNFPSRVAPVRPKESLGAQFGPSETETQLYLPTQEEIFLSQGRVGGPKIIRSGPLYKKEIDGRPLIIPQDYKDYDKVRRPNRPRIDEKYFEEAIEIDKRRNQETLPSAVIV